MPSTSRIGIIAAMAFPGLWCVFAMVALAGDVGRGPSVAGYAVIAALANLPVVVFSVYQKRLRFSELIAYPVCLGFAGIFLLPGPELVMLGTTGALWILCLVAAIFGPNAPTLRPLTRCPACAYDLTGNASGRCPECGAAAKAGAVRPIVASWRANWRQQAIWWLAGVMTSGLLIAVISAAMPGVVH